MDNITREQMLENLKATSPPPNLLVVGDIMLDKYIWGSVNRISPEAPVPVLKVNDKSERAGGAANVALNLANLGANTFLCGQVGNDSSRKRLLKILKEAGINIEPIFTVENKPTITKTRLIGGHQQMVRLDEEKPEAIPQAFEEKIIDYFEINIENLGLDGIILSDYAKGLLTENLCQFFIGLANDRNIPIFIDPKGVDFEKYTGATFITPNSKELAIALQIDLDSIEIDYFFELADQFRKKEKIENLVITRGEKGISLLNDLNKSVSHFPAHTLEVYDVSGAGDTVISVLARFFNDAFSLDQLMILANLAAGIVINKIGTVPLKLEELIQTLENKHSVNNSSKICTKELAKQRTSYWKSQGESVVFTNGCFDLLHVGHISFLEKAKDLGDRLIVGVNTDRSVRRLKGEERPINDQKSRVRILSALIATDAIVLFDEENPLKLINYLKPDILVKGEDYAEDEIVGAKKVKSWGGKVKRIELVKGNSTTSLIQKIKNNTK